VVRSDGHAFVQARAGLACCTPAIGRRVGFDAELPSGSGRAFLDLAADPLWDSPRDVRVTESGGAADTLCVDGASYDLYLLTAQRARHVRRACAPEEVGQAAPVLEAVLGAALGHEPRIDVLFPTGAKFDADKAAYREFVAQGGVLRPAPNARSTAVPEPSP